MKFLIIVTCDGWSDKYIVVKLMADKVLVVGVAVVGRVIGRLKLS